MHKYFKPPKTQLFLLSLILFGIVLIVLVLVGWFLLGRQNKVSNWKTYTNTQYGYSVKYPDNLSYEAERFYFTGDKNRSDTADGYGPEIQILFRGNGSASKAAEEEGIIKPPFETVTINNALGVKATQGIDYYLSSNNNVVIRFIFSPQDYSQTVSREKIKEMQNIANLMLSTFKFTN